MLPTLHMRLLGDFSLVYGDDLVPGVHTHRLHSLLAYLVLHGDAPQLREHLAFLFWPGSSEPQARNNLRQVLHQLRQLLPDAAHFLHADATTLRWRPEAPFQLDVAESGNSGVPSGLTPLQPDSSQVRVPAGYR